MTPRLKCFTEVNTTCHPIMSDSALHIKQPQGHGKNKFWVANNWWDPGYNLNENFWVGRIMRQFTFIASSMRKVLTHPVFLWRCVCSTITGQRQIADSSGKKQESNLPTKMWTILSSQIIKVEWSCNCCLRKIIYTELRHKRLRYLIYWVFRNKKHLPWTVHVETNVRGDGVWPRVKGLDGSSIQHVQDVSSRTPAPYLCYPLSYSSHKWICWLTFQGPEQQMISSSKAKDKENKSLVFCWEQQ